MLYTYRFIQAQADGFFNPPDHRSIIKENALEGWRFVTAIPTSFSGHGRILTFDLVFEKESASETE